MALPKIDVPTFMVEVPGMKGSVKCRPFLVKEEKLLLLANESDVFKDKISACIQVLESCVYDKIDIGELPMYQLQWLFLKIKAKSVGNVINFNLTCGECEGKRPYDMALDDFEIIGEVSSPTKLFKVNDEVSIRFKYPSAKVQSYADELSDVEMLINSIDKVYSGEEALDPSQETIEEMTQFVESLPLTTVEEVEDYLLSMPYLVHKYEYDCKKCNKHNYVAISGYESFFD